jgi:hypothetical protein
VAVGGERVHAAPQEVAFELLDVGMEEGHGLTFATPWRAPAEGRTDGRERV